MKKTVLYTITFCICLCLFFSLKSYNTYKKNNFLSPVGMKCENNKLVFINDNSFISIFHLDNSRLYTIKPPYRYSYIADITNNYIVVKDREGANINTSPSLSILDFEGNILYKYRYADQLRLIGENLYCLYEYDTSHLYCTDIKTGITEIIEIPSIDVEMKFVIHNEYLYYTPKNKKYELYRYSFNTKLNELIYSKELYSDYQIGDEYAYILDYNTHKMIAVDLKNKENIYITSNVFIRSFAIYNNVIYFTKYNEQFYDDTLNKTKTIYKADFISNKIGEMELVFE